MKDKFELLKSMFSLEIENKIEISNAEIRIFLTKKIFTLKRSSLKELLQKKRTINSLIINHDFGYKKGNFFNINKLYLETRDDVLDYVYIILKR